MRGYHAFLKQVPTSPPPIPVEGETIATANHNDLVAVSRPSDTTDWAGQPQFVGGMPVPTSASSEPDA